MSPSSQRVTTPLFIASACGLYDAYITSLSGILCLWVVLYDGGGCMNMIKMLEKNVQKYRINCGGKTSLEGNNSSSICCSTFLVYFLTMASQTGCEIMNSE